MNTEKLLNIYIQGVENSEQIMGYKFNKKRSIKTVLYYCALLLLGKYIEINQKEYFLLNARKFENDPITKKYDVYIFRGSSVYKHIKDFRIKPSFVSCMNYRERIKFFYITVIEYLKNSKEIKDFGTWLDCCAANAYAERMKGNIFISRGHYDELSTWMGAFAEFYGFSFYIYQHGVIGKDVIIPHKFYCSKLFVFDEYSEKYFRLNYIKNSDCKIEIYPFESSVEFIPLKKDIGIYYVGLVEQGDPKWIDNVIEVIRSTKLPIKIIVMKHPLSDKKYKKIYGKYVVESTDKYSNLDLIIADNSTLVIDYYRSQICTPIIATNIQEKEVLEPYVKYWSDGMNGLSKMIIKILKE